MAVPTTTLPRNESGDTVAPDCAVPDALDSSCWVWLTVLVLSPWFAFVALGPRRSRPSSRSLGTRRRNQQPEQATPDDREHGPRLVHHFSLLHFLYRTCISKHEFESKQNLVVRSYNVTRE